MSAFLFLLPIVATLFGLLGLGLIAQGIVGRNISQILVGLSGAASAVLSALGVFVYQSWGLAAASVMLLAICAFFYSSVQDG